MRTTAAGRTFYRLVRTYPPTEADFVPQGRMPGYRIRPGVAPRLLESIMNGVSVFDSVESARAQNDVFRKRRGGSLYEYVAILDVPPDSDILCDDEFGNEHHWDLYSTPGALLACMTGDRIPL